jgi:hypothetical protein
VSGATLLRRGLRYRSGMDERSFFGVLGLLSVAPHAFVAVDAALGQRPEKSLAVLREEVMRWRDDHHSELTDAHCERIVGWLNRNFYQLAE